MRKIQLEPMIKARPAEPTLALLVVICVVLGAALWVCGFMAVKRLIEIDHRIEMSDRV